MSLWLGPDPILLASGSRTRRTLLEAAGLPVETEHSGVDERALEAGLGPDVTPLEIAVRLAEAKANAVAARHPDRLVIGADQVLDLDGHAWGKPGSPDEACRQIARLAGREHRLHAAVAIARHGRVLDVFAETARLLLRPLREPAIAAYVEAAGEAATGSAGGYEIEGLGIHLFETIDGEHTTILGLPMLPLLAALRRLGLVGI
ncbi:MAG: maf [Enterovirga sp.]|jgi:septum formation protein|nr:maf [Enterovirga sp.]